MIIAIASLSFYIDNCQGSIGSESIMTRLVKWCQQLGDYGTCIRCSVANNVSLEQDISVATADVRRLIYDQLFPPYISGIINTCYTGPICRWAIAKPQSSWLLPTKYNCCDDLLSDSRYMVHASVPYENKIIDGNFWIFDSCSSWSASFSALNRNFARRARVSNILCS